MANVGELMRSAKELQDSQQQLLDAVSGMQSGDKGILTGISDFFHGPDNLLALGICIVAVVGIYRLLRSERIIPAPAQPTMPGLGDVLAGPMARRMIVRALFAIVLAALGLAMASGRLLGIIEKFKSLF